jgi:hypothetical protein
MHGRPYLGDFHNRSVVSNGDGRTIFLNAAGPDALPSPGHIKGMGWDDSRSKKGGGKKKSLCGSHA